LSSSRKYAESFAGFPCWKPSYDNLLVALTVNYGLKGAFTALFRYKSAEDWYRCAYPHSGQPNESLFREFVEARVRFIAYCLVSTLSTNLSGA